MKKGPRDGAGAGQDTGVAPWRRRLRASLWDLVPIWGCLGGVGAAGGLLSLCRINPFPRLFANAATADLTSFALTVLPAGVLLSGAEAGGSAASWGKRRTGLRVVDHAGEPPGIARAALRNAIKLAGWQVAHLGLLRVTGATGRRPRTRAIGSALLCGAYLVSAADLAPALLRADGRALHDLAAGTRVVTR